MKSKKIIAAALAIAMMVTSVQLPPVQVSAEETTEQSVDENTAIYLNQKTLVDASDDSQDIPVSVLSVSAGDQQSELLGAGNVLDNDPTSLWHTDWNGTSYEMHYIDFELSEDYIVSGLRYLPRSSGGKNGTITKYKIFVSGDGTNWKQVAEGKWDNDESWKVVNFNGQQTKYVRLKSDEAATENTGKVFASAAEIRLVGRQPEAAMTGISVKTAPKMVYSVGQMFDPTGLVLNLIYKDGQTCELAYSEEAGIEYDVKGELKEDNIAVVITYGEFTVTLPIVVMNVEIQEPPTELTPDDASRDYDVSKMTVSADSTRDGFEPENVKDGTQDTFWQADWSDATKKLEFTVELEEATRLEALRYLPKYKNEDGGTNGFIKEYRVDYSMDGSEWYLISQGDWEFTNEYKIAAFEAVTAKYVRLTAIKVLVRGEESTDEMAIAELRLRMAAEDTEPAEKTLEAILVNEAPNTLYTVGEKFDPTGLKLTCVYSDGSIELLEYTAEAGIAFSETDAFAEAGTKSITITYQEKTTTLNVVVQPVPVLTGIIVYKEPKTTYAEGDSFDPAGLKVKLVYDNEAKVEVAYAANPSAFAFAPDGPLKIDDDNVTIIYTVDGNNFTADLPIEIRNTDKFNEYQTEKADLDTLKTTLNNAITNANELLEQKNEQIKIDGAKLEDAQTDAFKALQDVVDTPSKVGDVPVVTEESSLAAIESAITEIASVKAVVEEETTTINNAITNVRNIYVDEATLFGHDLVLEGTIGINFIMTLDNQASLIEQNAYMQFTINDEVVEFPVEDAIHKDKYGVNGYAFKCGVPVKDMATKVTAQLIIPNTNQKSFVYEYSVNDYVARIFSDEQYEAAYPLVKAMSNFGDYAAAYFKDDKTNNTIDSITSIKPEGATQTIREELDGAMNSATDNLASTLAENNKPSIEGDSSIYSGSSLLLKSGTVLRHYFNKEVSVNDTPVTNKNGNYYYIESAGIAANDLGTPISMSVTVGDTTTTIKYSPLHYAYIVLNNLDDEDQKELKDLMRAMYVYYQAAEDYLNLSEES